MAGLKGIGVAANNATAVKPLAGLSGIVMVVVASHSVKVTDYRGRGIADVKITTNTGRVFYTDAQGNALIQADGTNVQLTLSKYKHKRKYSVPDGVAQVSFQFAKPLPR